MPYRIEPYYKRLGKAITEAREAAGMSVDDLAKKLDVSRPTMYNMEIARQRTSLHHIFKLEEIFGERNLLINKARGKNSG